ncbi:hypothetical protein QCA50_004392 [Cerrena zonata]|uniref:Uncharacterized protein n=1 Tax=Cerrena zonata TaxID=2478898 RepID=A0AAW0GLR6_9APHY
MSYADSNTEMERPRQRVRGYVPPEEWLLRRCRRKKLMKFKSSKAEQYIDALEKAALDVIEEAGLRGIAWLDIVVDRNDRDWFAICVASNFDSKRATPEQLQRLKDVFGTTEDPLWHTLSCSVYA